MGTAVINTLQVVIPEFCADQSIDKKIVEHIEPMEMLCDSRSREKIIRMMSNSKAHELAKQLGVSFGRNLYNDLVKAASERVTYRNCFLFLVLCRMSTRLNT